MPFGFDEDWYGYPIPYAGGPQLVDFGFGPGLTEPPPGTYGRETGARMWDLNQEGFTTGDGTLGSGGGSGFNLPTIQMPDIRVPDIKVPDITIGGGGGDARAQAVSLVNSAERILQQNSSDYKAGNLSAYEAAARFDEIWAQLVTKLQALGSEGQRAIADRQAGGKYDWFAAYRPLGIPITPGTPSSGGIISPTHASVLGRMDTKTLVLIAAIGIVIWVVAKRL